MSEGKRGQGGWIAYGNCGSFFGCLERLVGSAFPLIGRHLPVLLGALANGRHV